MSVLESRLAVMFHEKRRFHRSVKWPFLVKRRVFLASGFRADPAHISLAGTVNGDSAEMTGTAAEAPGISFRATLTKIAD
jgi:hypothetical protein